MNKILTASAILAAASMSFGFETWKGSEGLQRVVTDLDNGTETSGYWFNYGDDADGGASTVTWPVAKGDKYDENSMAPIIIECEGLCGEFALDKGTLEYDPFIGLGFNVAGVSEETNKPDVADASAWGGVCITYEVSMAATLELGLGDDGDKDVAYDNPFVNLPKATSATTKTFAWSKFKQNGWGADKGGKTVTGDAASKAISAVKFKVQAASGTGSFNIREIGPLTGGECGGSAIAPVAAKSALKAQLNGRTLSFGKTVAKAEVINLQGRVVMSASSVSTMDLSKVQAGVYMVRAAGLSQQIMVK